MPLDFSRATGHELKDVFTQALKRDCNGNPTVYKGTLYHDGKQYGVTRFYEMVRGQSVEKHAFSRQMDWKQPWMNLIENLFFVYVAQKTGLGQRRLDNVRREFEVLLKTSKDETRFAPPERALALFLSRLDTRAQLTQQTVYPR